MGSNPEIRYWSNTASEQLPLELTISSEGLAELKVGTNRDNPEIPAVGVFREEFKKRHLAPLVAALEAPDFAAIQPPEDLPPGSAVRELSVKDPSREQVLKYHGGGSRTPPAFATAEGEALKIVAAVRKKPVQAVGLQVVQAPNQLGRDEFPDLVLGLFNLGTEYIQVPHPDVWADEGVRIVLTAVRTDVPPAQIEPWHQRFEEFGRVEVRQVQAGSSDKKTLKLSPGDQARLTLRKKLDWPPGTYRACWFCVLPILDRQGQAVLRVEAVTPPFEVKGMGPAKADDVPSETASQDDGQVNP